MLKAEGVYCRTWSGTATANLVSQLPLIARTVPEITAYYPATVNVRFGPMVIVAGADYRTPPLKWKANGEDGETGEVFDFVRCRLTIGDRPAMNALLYVGHWSAHRLDPHKQEFLVERFVHGLAGGEPVVMECDRNGVELPYSKTNDADAAKTIVIW